MGKKGGRKKGGGGGAGVATVLRKAMEDIYSRFLLNLPEEELNTVERLFFQIEQAWWYERKRGDGGRG